MTHEKLRVEMGLCKDSGMYHCFCLFWLVLPVEVVAGRAANVITPQANKLSSRLSKFGVQMLSSVSAVRERFLHVTGPVSGRTKCRSFTISDRRVTEDPSAANLHGLRQFKRWFHFVYC